MNRVLELGRLLPGTAGRRRAYWQLIVSGVWWTLAVSACAWVIALVHRLGDRHDPHHADTWLVRLGNAWVELFRNIPLLVQMFLWYFVMPEFIPPLKAWISASRSRERAVRVGGALPRPLHLGARRRAGARRHPVAAARPAAAPAWRSGLTQPQVYRYVLLPMAFRIMIPPLTSETMNLIKNSSIALTIGLAELTFRSREMGEYTFHFFEAFIGGHAHLHRDRDDGQPRDGGRSSARRRCRATSPAAAK